MKSPILKYALPLLWLNPTSTHTNPNWRSLENLDWDYRGINYRYTPVTSGLGTNVAYPTITSGWGYNWGSEYTSMPELENSLIFHDNGYDTGILSQYLTGEDDILGEDQFDGDFSGNYLDSVLISNPTISESFDFSELYYSNVHSASGIYNDVPPISGQSVLVRNRVSDYNLWQSSVTDSGLSYSGNSLGSIYQTFQASTIEEVEYTLTNYNEYVSLKMNSFTTFGLDLTFKLPVIDRAGLNSIQVAFDSSIFSSSINLEFPISLRIYNFDAGRFESLPMAPITTSGYYNQYKVDDDFWTWNPVKTPSVDRFRPFWGTTDSNNMNTISFGVTYPYDVSNGDVWFDETQFNPSLGENFLDVSRSKSHDLNTYWSFKDDDNAEHHKVLYYDSSYNTNNFQFDNLIIDPDNFYTSIPLEFP